MAVSESCRLHDSSFGIRSFTKSELASQSNVRSCANLSGYKPIHGTFCVVLRSHFLLCKALNPEGQIVRMTTFSCIPTSRQTLPCAVELRSTVDCRTVVVQSTIHPPAQPNKYEARYGFAKRCNEFRRLVR